MTLDLSSRRGFLLAAGAASAAAGCADAAEPAPPLRLIDLAATPYSVDPTGARDCGEAITQAAADHPGALLSLPAGRFRLARSIRVTGETRPAYGRFVPGLRLIGAGIGATELVADGADWVIDCDYAADSEFRNGIGVSIADLAIGNGPQPSATRGGVRLRAVYNASLERLHIRDMRGTGVAIRCERGDADGSTMVRMRQVRIENCGGWGVDCAAGPGANEISYLDARQLLIQNCGTASRSGSPDSGGMRWKGQALQLESSGFVLNRNTGLFIEGAAGLAYSASVLNTTFENNEGVSWLITGCRALQAANIQIFVNAGLADRRATHGLLIDGARFACTHIDVATVLVRATASDAGFVAFESKGQFADPASILIRQVVWQNFDHGDQVRFRGIVFPPVPHHAMLSLPDAQTLALRANGDGNVMPLRLRGPAGGAQPSRSGEWIAHTVGGNGVVARASQRPSGWHDVYLYDRNGAAALAIARAAPVIDPVSGYLVDPQSGTSAYVGQVLVGAGGRFDQVRQRRDPRAA